MRFMEHRTWNSDARLDDWDLYGHLHRDGVRFI